MYVAIIGDIKNSKKITNRSEVQQKLESLLNEINNTYSNIAANFTITLGDEFQGLLNSSENVIEIIDYINDNIDVSIRYGIGVGDILTSINKEIAIGADGPAYHNARAAIDNVKLNEKRNNVFSSNLRIKVDNELEEVINTLFSLLSSIRNQRTNSQQRIIKVIKDNMTQKEIATLVQLDQSTVARLLSNGCYYEYKEAISTLKKLLMKVGV